jgi:DNA-directed RNA polymerase specialized sigma subunit
MDPDAAAERAARTNADRLPEDRRPLVREHKRQYRDVDHIPAQDPESDEDIAARHAREDRDAQLVYDVIAELPLLDQKIAAFRIEGLSEKAIADRLKMTQSAISKRLTKLWPHFTERLAQLKANPPDDLEGDLEQDRAA